MVLGIISGDVGIANIAQPLIRRKLIRMGASVLRGEIETVDFEWRGVIAEVAGVAGSAPHHARESTRARSAYLAAIAKVSRSGSSARVMPLTRPSARPMVISSTGS
jgi:hypothetical protein